MIITMINVVIFSTKLFELVTLD